MPIVFVHGVSVRRDEEYRPNEQARDAFFRNISLKDVIGDPAKVTILNPYWGQYGATFAWGNASLPDQKYESFGADEDAVEQILAEVAPSLTLSQNRVLVDLAHESLAKAIDCLWAVAAYTKSEEETGADLADWGVKAMAYARTTAKPEWLAKVSNDDQFTERLLDAIDESEPGGDAVESFGAGRVKKIWDHLKISVTNLGTRAAGIAVNPAVRAARPWVHHKISFFLGDIFVYLDTNKQGKRQKIIDEVANALRAGAAAKTKDDDKLIVVAHSMGGNITYDILSSMLPDLEVDLYLTVASQVGLFEELKLFVASDRNLPSEARKTLDRPKGVKRWINVMDPSDVLAYSTGRIFGQSEDMKFSTGAPVWSAHSMYFYMPFFHERLRARLLEGPDS